MTRTVEVENELQDLFQEEVDDVRRENREKFVYTSKPSNIKPSYPYILISLADNQKNNLTIGKTEQFQRHRIQASIRVGKNNKFYINGEKRGNGYVKNYLAESCDIAVQSNQDRFRNLGDDIYSLLPDSANPSSPGDSSTVTNDYILRRSRTT